MQNTKWQRFFGSLLVAAMLVGAFAPAASAAVERAPMGVTAGEVTGEIPGGQFAKYWLGLKPTQPGATVTVVADWDRLDALANGVGFYILSPEHLARVQSGNDIRDNNLAAGGPVFQGSSNQQIATFTATGSDYTLVIFNDSNSDAKFTVTATNGLISDDSGQVMSDAEATETPAVAAPAATATPAAVTATTATTATATTTTTTAVATATATPALATTPATTGQPAVVKATEMKGSLPTEGSQNFLGLEPTDKDGEINLTMLFDPQDNQELARRIGFWVLDDQGFQRFTQGTPASQLAIAAGSRTFLGESNERKATFNAAGFGPYTVIVYNNSNVPATYSLRVDGGLLIDDSGQTETARATAGVTTTVATTAAPVAATTTTTKTAAATTAAATTTTAAATTSTTSQPGGTHTIRAGESLSILARDVYGDIQLYDEICRFNSIANCDLVEVGDVIKLPTRAQISAGISAPAATTTAATTAATAPAATAPAASTAVTKTATTTTTTTTAPTTPVTRTTTTTTTTTTRPATGQDIVSVANSNGNFTILVKALQATGLDKTLQGGGPFTILAPTDAAFEALGTATVNALLNDKAQLTQILQFHVVPNRIASSGISNGMEAATVLGSPVEFTVSGNNIKVQDSNVVVPDVAASNGVIHVIDKVMLPPAP